MVTKVLLDNANKVNYRTFVVGGDETENIVMPKHDSLIYLSLSKPGSLLSWAEYLNGDVLAAPTSPPYLAKSAFADRLD